MEEGNIMATYPQAGAALGSLAIFRNLLDDPVLSAFRAFCLCQGSAAERAYLCAAFAAALYRETDDFPGYILEKALADENPYVERRAMGRETPRAMEESLAGELAVLQDATSLSSGTVRAELAELGWTGFLPGWRNGKHDFAAAYREQMEHIAERGYGIFASHHMFTVEEDGLRPVVYPETVRLCDLTGYERERELAVRNAQALLEGKPAANVLLYGDAGTGKSTCVKAIANEYREQGLRLIELRKDQLFRIPGLIGKLSRRPLKFILFIDDLSFSKNDGNFSALKAMLEGSVAAKSPNIAIYATSNRRHLVLEKFSDREGDEIHLNDTMQELSSLSDRFGLVITFVRPDRELYQAVVKSYLTAYGIQYDGEAARRAEAYALQCGGRSPRVARHFAEFLVSQGGPV